MRINGPTPQGGDYSEVFYFDSNDNIVSDPDIAVRGVVRECTQEGILISNTWFYLDNKQERGSNDAENTGSRSNQ